MSFDYDTAMADPDSHVFINVSQGSDNKEEVEE